MLAGWLCHVYFKAELWAFLVESFFDDLNGECLMHTYSTHSTLMSTAMWSPAVVRGCPWPCALCNQLLFVLLCLFALVPVGFLVYIGLRIYFWNFVRFFFWIFLVFRVSWQVQYFVDLAKHISWQVQDFVGLGVQSLWQAQDFL